MEITNTAFPDVKLIHLKPSADERGWFMENFRANDYSQMPGANGPFVQDNVSYSKQGVLRGLHFQHPGGQGKLMQVIQGTVYDVMVDVRQRSPTFGQWQGLTLTADKPCHLWVPPGYAHGFMVLSQHALIQYKCTNYYQPQHEACLLWNDPDLRIEWPAGRPQLSEKDRNGTTLSKLVASGKCPA